MLVGSKHSKSCSSAVKGTIRSEKCLGKCFDCGWQKWMSDAAFAHGRKPQRCPECQGPVQCVERKGERQEPLKVKKQKRAAESLNKRRKKKRRSKRSSPRKN